MARRCGCALRISLATRWSSGSSALNLSSRRRCLAKEKAERTKTTNTSTFCPISDAGVANHSPQAATQGPITFVSLLRRLRLDWLLHHFPPRLVRSLYVFVNGFVTIGVLAVLALVSRNPFVFPSLGPTAYLLFFCAAWQNLQPAKHYFRSCHRPHLRLWGIRCHRRRSTAVWSASRNLLAKNPCGGAFALNNGRIHGSVRRQPSARRRDHADRFPRNYFETERTGHYRSGGVPAEVVPPLVET